MSKSIIELAAEAARKTERSIQVVPEPVAYGTPFGSTSGWYYLKLDNQTCELGKESDIRAAINAIAEY